MKIKKLSGEKLVQETCSWSDAFLVATFYYREVFMSGLTAKDDKKNGEKFNVGHGYVQFDSSKEKLIEGDQYMRTDGSWEDYTSLWYGDYDGLKIPARRPITAEDKKIDVGDGYIQFDPSKELVVQGDEYRDKKGKWRVYTAGLIGFFDLSNAVARRPIPVDKNTEYDSVGGADCFLGLLKDLLSNWVGQGTTLDKMSATDIVEYYVKNEVTAYKELKQEYDGHLSAAKELKRQLDEYTDLGDE